MLTIPPTFPLRVFYDGSCSVCAGEMQRYRRRELQGRLKFIDISDPAFDPRPYGISYGEFMHQMHAIDGKGRVYRGVEAFGAIWQAFPDGSVFRLMGSVIMLPGVNQAARLGYYLFARVRKYLPTRVPPCAQGVCEHRRTPPP